MSQPVIVHLPHSAEELSATALFYLGKLVYVHDAPVHLKWLHYENGKIAAKETVTALMHTDGTYTETKREPI